VRRLSLFILIFTCALTNVKAQVNYVKNASLEKHSRCPWQYDQIRFADFWSPIDSISMYPLCAAEYCNTCDTVGFMGVPIGAYYYHYPRSGNGMAQLIMYTDESFLSEVQRDYLQGRLYKSLTAGKSYCVTFYVTLAQFSKYACNNIGAYLDDGSIDIGQDSAHCAYAKTMFTPQILETSVINDTLNWVKVQGSLTATSSEKFITIGNFLDKAHTDTIDLGINGPMTWYLVDDVSVIESNAVANAGPDKIIGTGDSIWIGTNEEGMPCTWYISGSSTPIGYSGGLWVKPATTTTYVVEMDLCGHVTKDSANVQVFPAGIKPVSGNNQYCIWPNPVSNELNIEYAAGCDVRIYNALGRMVYSTKVISEKEVFQVGALSAGLYSLCIVDPVTGYRSVRKMSKE